MLDSPDMACSYLEDMNYEGVSNSLIIHDILASHIALFCSHDNTGYLVKYIDPILGLDQN
jgi:hypothetical protein